MMSRDWLLIEVLGARPIVVAQGHDARGMIPVETYMARNPHKQHILDTIAAAVRRRERVVAAMPASKSVIRVEPIEMLDGIIHGVQMWIGRVTDEPPPRVLPGAVLWDLDTGMGSSTNQALQNSGKDPKVEPNHGRTFAQDMPVKFINPRESEVLAQVLKAVPGEVFCNTWTAEDFRGRPVRAGFVTRILREHVAGRTRTVCRAINWGVPINPASTEYNDLARHILLESGPDGMHRALVDVTTWRVLKWIDDPCAVIPWSRDGSLKSLVHPEDIAKLVELANHEDGRRRSEILRFAAHERSWVSVRLTVSYIRLEPAIYVGLVAFSAAAADQ